MPKIRTVKPELFRHEDLFAAARSTGLPLRLAFIGLFTCCDREGRFKWQPCSLKLDILPYDEVDFEQVLDALCQIEVIKKYSYAGKCYGFIPSWHDHQVINKREPLSKLPEPTEELLCDFTLENNQIIQSVNDSAAVCTAPHMHARALPVHAPLEWNGNGREVELEVEKEVEVEKEQGREGEVENNIVAPARQRLSNDSSVMAVFNHWKQVCCHPQAVLDNKRKKLIRNALKSGYSPTQLCQAITGCSYTPHNMGDNDRGQRYDGLHVILRDADQIDRFIHNAHNPPKPPNAADKLLAGNRYAAQSWLEKQPGGVYDHEIKR